MPGLRIEVVHDLVGESVAVLDERDRAGERAPVAGAHGLHERLARPLTPVGHGCECYVAGSSPIAAGAFVVRKSANAVAAPSSRAPAAITYVQRAPAFATSAPAETIASPSTALWTL